MQTQPGPVPHFDLDHLMLKVDDLAAARAAMGRLGFTTSPYRTNDPMGGGRTGGRGGNHLVLFEPLVPDTTNMLELAYCDVPHAMPAMREVLGGPQGFAMLVVSPADLRALRAWWTAQGFDFSPVIGQRFDWQDPETGQRDLIHFEVVVPQSHPWVYPFNAAKMLDFTHYERPAWRRHANTARHWTACTVAVDDADFEASPAMLQRIYGQESVAAEAGGLQVRRGPLRFVVMRRSAFAEHLRDALGDAAAPCHSSIHVQVDSLDQAARVMSGNGVPFVRAGSGLLVPPAFGCGVAYAFSEAPA